MKIRVALFRALVAFVLAFYYLFRYDIPKWVRQWGR